LPLTLKTLQQARPFFEITCGDCRILCSIPGQKSLGLRLGLAPHGRSTTGGSTWLKVKSLGREEFFVVGFTDPEKSRVGFDGLLLGYYAKATGKLTYAGRSAPASTTSCWRTCAAAWMRWSSQRRPSPCRRASAVGPVWRVQPLRDDAFHAGGGR
jgi:hypothetical protein